MAGKKSVCATPGILWKMMAFQPFHVWNYNYILPSYYSNANYETLT